MRALLLAFAAAFAVTLVPELAHACAVCGTLPEQSRQAYIAMTAFLSLLPLAGLGGIVWFAVRGQLKDANEPRPEIKPER